MEGTHPNPASLTPDLDRLDDKALLEAAMALSEAGPREGSHAAATAWCDVAADRVDRLFAALRRGDDLDLGLLFAVSHACEPHERLGTWARRNGALFEQVTGAVLLLVLWAERARPGRFAARFERWARQSPELAERLATRYLVVHDDPELAYLMVDIRSPGSDSPESPECARACLAMTRAWSGEPATDRDRAALAVVTPRHHLRWSFLHDHVMASIGRARRVLLEACG